jgi:signal transduction histidine kinase
MTSEKNLVHEELTQTELFQKIGDICTAVTAVISPRELLEVSLKQTMNLFGANRGSIFLLKEDSHDLILKIALGMNASEEEKMVKRIGEGIVGKVAKLKEPVFVDDISRDVRFKNFKSRSSYKTPSFLCAPLLIKDELLGVINIADKKSGQKFTKNELQLLDFLSSQIALNYRRIQLHQKLKHIVREKESLEDRLGKTDRETQDLKRQIIIHEKLATIGKLAGGIAHEFNNPLDGVMRYTNLCLEHTENEVVRGYLLEIKQGLNRMAKIVRNLLACSRNDAPAKQKIHLSTVLDHALIGIQSDLAGKTIKIEREIPNDLPLILDLGMERVLSNLLRNAADAIHDKGKIKTKATFKKPNLTIAITDNGVGINAEDLQKIFEPFFTTKDIDKGCGLGLTITSEIVKSYNGKIDVESNPGRGTTFTVTLPLGE